jgi:trehalose 6-phosphate phosphatase
MRSVDPTELARDIRLRANGRHFLVLCDFDGTLAEFDPDPHAVWLPESIRDALNGIAGARNATVGLVSGRRLADIRSRADLGEHAFYAGFHGLEIEGEGMKFVHPDVHASRERIQSLVADIGREVHGLGGVFVENKDLSLVVHFRAATTDVQLQVREIIDRHALPQVQAGRLRIMKGSCARELMPLIRWNKGTAVAWICDRVERRHGPTWPLYIGDDVTDEDAFNVVKGRGLGVAASDRVTSADVKVNGPAGVETLLAALRS